MGLGAPWPDCSLALDLGALPVGPILPGSDFRIDAPYGWVTVHFGSVEEMAELAAVDVAPYYELKAGDGAAFLDVSGGLVRVDNSRLACDTDHVAATLRVDGAALHAVAADPYDATVLTGSAPPAVGLQSLVMETSPEPHVERLDLWSIGTFQLKELHLE